MEYRYQHFQRTHLRESLAFQAGRDPGWPAPDFDLPTTRGGRVRRAELTGKQPLLVLFASITDPIAASAAPGLKRLYAEYGHEIEFVTVYVREAHPGDRIPQPRTMEWKSRHARMYEARDAIPWDVAVDDLEGSVHRAFGGNGASAFLVDAKGDVAFRTLFSNDGRAIGDALAAMRRGSGHPYASSRTLVPALAGLLRTDDVLRAAGPRAVADFRREAPLVYGAAELAWIWRTLTPAGRLAVAAAGAALAIGAAGASRLARRRAT